MAQKEKIKNRLIPKRVDPVVPKRVETAQNFLVPRRGRPRERGRTRGVRIS